MFENLMHALIGNSASSTLTASTLSSGLLAQQQKRSTSKKIFSGNIEVQQVSNGYVINIATREGYEYETHIAHTIVEVNEIIAAAMVAFQLEK